MTREEAIASYEKLYAYMVGDDDAIELDYGEFMELNHYIRSALRPVSREQVVLCKDCQYWQGNNGGYPHPECRWGHDETPDEDDYCSFAERLEVNKNG